MSSFHIGDKVWFYHNDGSRCTGTITFIHNKVAGIGFLGGASGNEVEVEVDDPKQKVIINSGDLHKI